MDKPLTANSKLQTREQTASIPCFSIIIPVYNVAPYLRECLDSILAQTFTDWECLCVDDGSTDASTEILDEYTRQDARFRVFHKKNGGVSSARNLALRHARGEWVCFADSDDIAYPWWLTTFTYFHSHTNADLIRVAYPSHRPYNPTPPNLESIPYSVFSENKKILEWGWATFGQDGYPFLYAIRRILLRDIHFLPDVRLKEDILFALSFLPKITSAIQCDVITYWYRYRDNSAIRRHPPYAESLKRIQHYIRIYQEQEILCQTYNANLRFASSWLILSEVITIIDNHKIKHIPEILNYCINQNVFALVDVPLKWRLFLSWCIKGHTWPLQLAFYWLWFKRAIVRWWIRN